MESPPWLRRRAKAFRRTLSFFSIRKRAGGCCRSRLCICSRGPMRCGRAVHARECYCSAIDVAEGSGKINTAQNIVELEKARDHSKSGSAEQRLKLWIANDQCPPSPGCTLATPRLSAALTPDLAGAVVVWQYAQSPRRWQFTRGCPANYDSDGKCYAPGLAHDANAFVDLNTADTPDPSEGR